MVSKADVARRGIGKSKLQGLRYKLKGKPLFMACFGIGAVFIFLSDTLNSPVFIGVFIPMLVMGVYLLTGLNGFLDTIDVETFADSVYYLGFLFTLVSLSAALFYLRNADPSLNLIVSKFGLALLTTILGLAVRVVLVNFKISSAQAEDAMQQNLTKATERFIQDLEVSCDKMEILLQGSLDNVERTSASMQEASTLASNSILENSQANEKYLKESFEAASVQWQSSVQQLAVTIENRFVEAFSKTLQQIEGLGSKFESEMQKFNIDPNVFSQALQRPLEELASSVRDGKKQLDLEFEQLRAVSETQEQIRERQQRLSNTLKDGEAAISELGQQAEKLGLSFSSIESLEVRLSELDRKLGGAATGFEQLGGVVASSSSILSQDVKACHDAIVNIQTGLKVLVASIATQAKQVEALVTKMSEDAESGRTALRYVQDNLVESSQVIIKHLK